MINQKPAGEYGYVKMSAGILELESLFIVQVFCL